MLAKTSDVLHLANGHLLLLVQSEHPHGVLELLEGARCLEGGTLCPMHSAPAGLLADRHARRDPCPGHRQAIHVH